MFSGCWTSLFLPEWFQTPDGSSEGSPCFLLSAEMILEGMLSLLETWSKGRGLLRL